MTGAAVCQGCGGALVEIAPGVWGCRRCHPAELWRRAAAGRPQPGPARRRAGVGPPSGTKALAAVRPVAPAGSGEGPAADSESAAGRLAYRGIPLDGTVAQFHRAVDQLAADTVPFSYWRKVRAARRPAQPPQGWAR